MTYYICNGVVRVIETGIIYGTSSQTEKFVPAAKRIEKFARKELRSNQLFVNLYSEVNWIGEATTEIQSFHMTSCGTKSLLCGSTGSFKLSSKIAPYFRTNEGKYECLWVTDRFEPKHLPEFLNVHILAKKMTKVIGDFTLKVGALRCRNHQAIAWELTSEKGTFYIPWHNGCVFQKAEESEVSFEERELKELNSHNIYCALRFEEESKGVYRILVC